jgi:hypothetical protein
MATICVTGLHASCKDSDLIEFFSYCGKVVRVMWVEEAPVRTAEITFATPDAVGTAELLSGATIAHGEGPVTIKAVDPSEGHQPRSSTRAVVDRIQAGGLLKGSVSFMEALLRKAGEIDEKLGFSDAVKRGTNVAVDTFHEAIAPAPQRVYTTQWEYQQHQPQWGDRPSWK